MENAAAHGPLGFPGPLTQWRYRARATSLGTNTMSGTATLSVGNWIAIGRGGAGVLNLSGSAVVNKTGGGNIVIPGSGIGVVNQSGGTFNVTGGQEMR